MTLSADKNDLIFYCYFAYVGPFWFIGLFSGSRNRSLRFHVNQGLVLFICEIITIFLVRAAGKLLRLITFAGIGLWLSRLLWLAAIAGMIWFSAKGMLNVAKNRKEPLPVIGWLTLVK